MQCTLPDIILIELSSLVFAPALTTPGALIYDLSRRSSADPGRRYMYVCVCVRERGGGRRGRENHSKLRNHTDNLLSLTTI